MLKNYFYRYVRRKTHPIEIDKALVWKRRLSIGYGLLAWNALGAVLYLVYSGRGDWAHYYGLKTDEEKAMPPGQAWANTLGIKNAKVLRISGVTKVDEYQIANGDIVPKNKNTSLE